jgi:hypothetical protein
MTKTRKNKRNPNPNPRSKHKTGGSGQDLNPRATEEINELYSNYSKILKARIKGSIPGVGQVGRSMSLNRPPVGNAIPGVGQVGRSMSLNRPPVGNDIPGVGQVGRSMSLNRPPVGNGQPVGNEQNVLKTKKRGLFGRFYNTITRTRPRPVFSSKERLNKEATL